MKRVCFPRYRLAVSAGILFVVLATFRNAITLFLERVSPKYVLCIQDVNNCSRVFRVEPTPEPSPEPTPEHVFLDNGLLEVNPAAGHPILKLMRRSKERWEAKLLRQSRTLDEAVSEYKRRYGRAPPMGFDAWWDYVQANNVQLPDEYDQINNDLAALWGIVPDELDLLRAEREDEMITVTIGKEREEDPIKILKYAVPEGEEDHILSAIPGTHISLLQPIEHHLPPFRMILDPYDNANFMFDFDAREAAIVAAQKREYADISSETFQETRWGWIYACSPSSPARSASLNLSEALPVPSHPPEPRTFIYDVKLAMDPCIHPDLLRLSGEYLFSTPGPYAFAIPTPQFAMSKTALHADISIASMYAWHQPDPDGVLAWENKTRNRLLWRGRNTGIFYGEDFRWLEAHRTRLVLLASATKGNVSVLDDDEHSGPIGNGTERGFKELNELLMDVSFVDQPSGCDDNSVCPVLAEMFNWTTPMGYEDELKYKFILDVDGNGWSSRFQRLLANNAVVFKATIYPEWFNDRIQPWVHYVPIKMDYSDLYDALLFYRSPSNDHYAQEIARSAMKWTQSFWRKEDMTAYQFRLLLEYIRVMSEDREEMTYRG